MNRNHTNIFHRIQSQFKGIITFDWWARSQTLNTNSQPYYHNKGKKQKGGRPCEPTDGKKANTHALWMMTVAEWMQRVGESCKYRKQQRMKKEKEEKPWHSRGDHVFIFQLDNKYCWRKAKLRIMMMNNLVTDIMEDEFRKKTSNICEDCSSII